MSSSEMKKAVRMMEAARLACGGVPKTEAEWKRVVEANEQLFYAMLCDGGVDKVEARLVAKLAYQTGLGRSLLKEAFRETGEDHGQP